MIKGEELPIKKIFSDEFEHHIPVYQRPYAWQEEHAETLFDNLFDFYSQTANNDYFLGSIVLIKKIQMTIMPTLRTGNSDLSR